MRFSIGDRGRGGGAVLGHTDRIRLLEALWQARGAGRAVAHPPAHPVANLDAIGVGAATALRAGDRLCAPARYLAAHIARAESGERPGLGFATDAADLTAVAAGVALALHRAGSDGVTMALVDDGALATPAWPELVAETAEGAALVLVVDCTSGDVAPGRTRPVDGVDVEAVLAAARAAVEDARTGGGLRVVSCLRPAPGLDPLRAYVRRLRAIGFPRAEIEAVGRPFAGGLR